MLYRICGRYNATTSNEVFTVLENKHDFSVRSERCYLLEEHLDVVYKVFLSVHKLVSIHL